MIFLENVVPHPGASADGANAQRPVTSVNARCNRCNARISLSLFAIALATYRHGIFVQEFIRRRRSDGSSGAVVPANQAARILDAAQDLSTQPFGPCRAGSGICCTACL